MPRALEAGTGQRTHVFAPSLRCDTQLEFAASASLGRQQWRKLPTPETTREGSGWVALMQAIALLKGKVPLPQEVARVSRDKLPALAPGDFLVRLPILADGLSATWRPGSDRLSPATVDAQVLACLSGPKGLSWALVVGWEQVQRWAPHGSAVVGASMGSADTVGLLLLDARLACPWATSFNARMLVSEKRWLGLDGEVQACELLGLMELRLQ